MKRFTINALFAVTILLIIAPLSHAATTFTAGSGSDTDIRNSSNWDNGVPTAANLGTIDGSSAAPDATWDGDVAASTAYHIEIINGGTLKRGTSANNEFRGDMNVKVTDGVIDANPGGGITKRVQRLKNTTTITVEDAGSFLIGTKNLELFDSAAVVVNGGTVTANSIKTVNLTASAAFLTFGPGDGWVDLASTFTINADDGYIDFLSGSGGKLDIANADLAYYTNLWNDGYLKYDGVNTGEFADHFTVSGGVLSLKERYWDSDASAGLTAGNGTWDDGSSTVWSRTINDSTTLITWDNSANPLARAVFKANGSSTVTVSGTVKTEGITVSGTGYVITNGTAIEIGAGGLTATESMTNFTPVTMTASQTWSVASGKTNTVKGLISSGGYTLVKDGDGELLLTALGNFNGGALVINGGTVALDGGQDRIHDNVPLTIKNGGKLDIRETNAIRRDNSSNADITIDGGILTISSGARHSHFQRINLINGGSLQTEANAGNYIGQNMDIRNDLTVSGSSASYITLKDGLGISSPQTFNVANVTGDSNSDLIVNAELEDGGVLKTGDGTMEIIHSCIYTEGTTINAGTILTKNNTALGSGDLTVNSGGTLDIASSSSDVGTLTVSDTTFSSGASLKLDINGTGSAGTDYDQLIVNGSVSLGSADLNLSLGTAVQDGDKFFIIKNDGTDAVSGTFNGMAQGSEITLTYGGNDYKVKISYQGDADTGSLSGGNDVVIYDMQLNPADYSHRVKITFSGYSGSRQTLTNFPALVRLSGSITGFNYNDLQSSGADLRFTDSDGETLLNYEIEDWNTSGESPVWVQIPELEASGEDYIYAYWGNSSVSAPAYTTDGSTWSEGYKAVWHLNSRNGSLSPDSTANSADGTINGSVVNNTGLISNCEAFDAGGGERITYIADNTTWPQYTVSVWIKPTVTGQASATSFFNNDSTNDFQLEADNAATYVYNGGQDGNFGSQSTSWNYITVTCNSGTPLTSLYQDGSLITTLSSEDATMGQYQIGCNRAKTKVFNGKIDELRVSSVARPADWIYASYETQKAGSTFTAFSRASLYWDTDDATAGLQDGDGNWTNGTETIWSSSDSGTTPLFSWDNSETPIAHFKASGTSAVAVDSAGITAAGMVVDGSGYTVSGGTVSLGEDGLAANEDVTIDSAIAMTASQTWSVASGKTVTQNGLISSGGYTFVKDGDGTLDLTVVDNFSGGVVVFSGGNTLLSVKRPTIDNDTPIIINSGATVILNANQAVYRTSAANAPITIDGGTLTVATGIRLQYVANMILKNGASWQTATDAGGYGGQNFTMRGNLSVSGNAASTITMNKGLSLDDIRTFDIEDATGNDDADLVVDAELEDAGGILKTGSGTMKVTHLCTYTGGTTISEGTIIAANNTALGTGGVTVNSGGTLEIASNSSDVGTLTVADTTFASGATLKLDINGSGSAGTDYDQLIVNGTLDVSGATFSVSAGYNAVGTETIVIVDNDGTDAVVGRFNGLGTGAAVAVGNGTLYIRYDGGDGNDIILGPAPTTGNPSVFLFK